MSSGFKDYFQRKNHSNSGDFNYRVIPIKDETSETTVQNLFGLFLILWFIKAVNCLIRSNISYVQQKYVILMVIRVTNEK